MAMMVTLDIEVYDKYGPDVWAQTKYLVHGYDDVLWTNDIEQAVGYLRGQMETEPWRSR